MAKNIEYNTYLTEKELADDERFRRGKKSHKLYDAEDKLLGSVSDDSLYDLRGEQIAALRSEEERTDENENKVRVAEYASDARSFRMRGNKLYALSGAGENFVGYCPVRERRLSHIIVLSVLAVALAVIIALIAIIGLPASETVQPIIDIRDVNGSWEAQGTIAVFPDKLQPGMSGEYDFKLNNPHDEDMLYTFEIEPSYEGKDPPDSFPIKFRLRIGNQIVATEQWRTVEELKFTDMVILGHSVDLFTLEWQWAFDDGNNENDTAIGRDGGKISMILHVTAQAR